MTSLHLVLILAFHIWMKSKMLGISSSILLLFAPVTYFAYLHFLGLYSTEGAEEAFAYLVFVIAASMYATKVQKEMNEAAKHRSQ